jgi:hypothetical protein
LEPTIFETVEKLSARMIGDAGDDRDLVTVRDPTPTMFVCAIGGSVHLRREVVGDEKDFHVWIGSPVALSLEFGSETRMNDVVFRP